MWLPLTPDFLIPATLSVRPGAALLLAGDAELGPRHGVKALRRDGRLAFGADAVDAFRDALQRKLNLPQQAGVLSVLVQENPL